MWEEHDALAELPPRQFIPAFMRLAVKPDVVLPPPPSGDPPA
jgi:hypothetical protein